MDDSNITTAGGKLVDLTDADVKAQLADDRLARLAARRRQALAASAYQRSAVEMHANITEALAHTMATFAGAFGVRPAPAPAAITTDPIVRDGDDPLGRAPLIDRVARFLAGRKEVADYERAYAVRLVEAAFQGDDFPMMSIREMVTAEVEALRQMVIDLWEAWAEGKRLTDEGAANIAQHVNAWRPGEPVDVDQLDISRLTADYENSPTGVDDLRRQLIDRIGEAAALRALVVELVEGVPVQRYREILVEISTWSGPRGGNAAGKARAALAEVDRMSAAHGIEPTKVVEAIVPDDDEPAREESTP